MTRAEINRVLDHTKKTTALSKKDTDNYIKTLRDRGVLFAIVVGGAGANCQ